MRRKPATTLWGAGIPSAGNRRSTSKTSRMFRLLISKRHRTKTMVRNSFVLIVNNMCFVSSS